MTFAPRRKSAQASPTARAPIASPTTPTTCSARRPLPTCRLKCAMPKGGRCWRHPSCSTRHARPPSISPWAARRTPSPRSSPPCRPPPRRCSDHSARPSWRRAKSTPTSASSPGRPGSRSSTWRSGRWLRDLPRAPSCPPNCSTGCSAPESRRTRTWPCWPVRPRALTWRRTRSGCCRECCPPRRPV